MNNLAVANPKMLDLSLIDHLTARGSSRPLSVNSKKTYLRVAKQFNRFLQEHDLTLNENSLQIFFSEIKNKYTASTLNLKKNALKKVISSQVGSDSLLKRVAIDKVFEHIDSYKVDKVVEKDVCLKESVISELIDISTAKTGLLIRFIYKTGCRVSEAVNIKFSDCRITNNQVKIRIIGKGNKQRFLYIPKSLFIGIKKAYRSQVYLFESRTGNQLHRVNISKQIKNVGKKLDLDISAHTLRHSRATDLLLEKNFSLKAVSNHLGHSSTSITADMYIHDSVDIENLFEMDTV